MPEGKARDGHELAILEAMGAPLNAEYGYASRELQRVVERSLALAESLGRRDSSQRALVALCTSRQVQGCIATVIALRPRPWPWSIPIRNGAAPRISLSPAPRSAKGMPADAARHFQLAATLSGDGHALSVGTRPAVHSRAWAAHAHWLLGHEDAALVSCRDAIAPAGEIDHPYSLATALAYAGITHQLRGDVPAMTTAVAEARDLCDRYGFA